MTNDLNTLARPDLAPAAASVFSKRTKLIFIGFAAVCIAAITMML
jgi:hypothetical protein